MPLLSNRPDSSNVIIAFRFLKDAFVRMAIHFPISWESFRTNSIIRLCKSRITPSLVFCWLLSFRLKKTKTVYLICVSYLISVLTDILSCWTLFFLVVQLVLSFSSPPHPRPSIFISQGTLVEFHLPVVILKSYTYLEQEGCPWHVLRSLITRVVSGVIKRVHSARAWLSTTE